MLRLLGWLVLRVLARTTITGRENLKAAGPVIYIANHASTFDALLLITLLPKDTFFVGPGDFKLLWPANWIIKYAGLIPMKRGGVDRDGLKRLLEILKSSGSLAMFPEGGTWEKPIDDVKSGVSYLSQAAEARLVPMGFGGTYQVWRSIFRLRRPRIDVRIGPVLPPVTVSEDRKRRQEDLQASAEDLMHQIYDLLPRETQARYDDLARMHYRGALTLIALIFSRRIFRSMRWRNWFSSRICLALCTGMRNSRSSRLSARDAGIRPRRCGSRQRRCSRRSARGISRIIWNIVWAT